MLLNRRTSVPDRNRRQKRPSPHFTQSVYEAEEIPEDANLNALVTEVKALDDDTASPVTYSIVDGNIYNAFLIENTTGKIKVNSQLDYENITNVSVLTSPLVAQSNHTRYVTAFTRVVIIIV